jgi:uncharacterized protein (DUF58 family)
VSSLVPVLVGLVILAGFFQIGFIFHAAYILLGLVILGHLWGGKALRGVRVTRTLDRRALLGDTLRVTLAVENAGLWPIPWLIVRDRLPPALTAPPTFTRLLSLLPRERSRLTYELVCRQRGLYRLGPVSLSAGDVFGANRVDVDLSDVEHFVVYPRIVPLGSVRLSSRTPFGHIRSDLHLYADPSRVVGVRDYSPGDSFRLMHWTATAATGRLQVRRLEPAISLQVAIVVNLSRAEYDTRHSYHATELAITTAASVANHLIELRQETGVFTNGYDPLERRHCPAAPVGKGRMQLISILEMLGRIEVAENPDETTAFADLLSGLPAALPWGATVLAITSHAETGLWERLLALKRAGFEVGVVFCDYAGTISYEQAEATAASLGIGCRRVWEEADLDGWATRPWVAA